MNLGPLIATGLRMMTRYKLRSFAMMLGSLLGVAALTLVVSLGTAAERKMLATVRHFFSASTILVTSGGALFSSGPRADGARLTLDDIQALAKELPSIDYWDPIAVVNAAEARYQGASTTVRLVGSSERAERAWSRGVSRGEYFDAAAVGRSARVALLGETVARKLFPDQDPLGAEVLIGSVPCEVLGVLEPLGTDAHGMDRDNEIVLPITTVMRRVSNTDAITGAKLLTKNPVDVPQTALEVKRVLRERHALGRGSPDDFRIMTPTEVQALVTRARSVFFVFMPLVAAIVLLGGAIVSMALMLASVNQRTAEIGLRRAVGARTRDIALQFVAETLVTLLIGGALGVLLGSGGALAVAHCMALTGVLCWQAPLLGLVLSAAVGLMAGVLPARRAARLQPTDALR